MNRGPEIVLKMVVAPALAGLVVAPAFASAPATHPGAKPSAHAKPAKKKEPKPVTVPGGVRVAGVRVGGLRPGAAAGAVQAAFGTPLPVVVDGTRIDLHPARLATPYVAPAIGRARSSSAGTNIHLTVSVHGDAVRAVVAELARRFDHRSRNAELKLRKGRPFIKPAVVGTTLDRTTLVARIVSSLSGNARRPISVRTHRVKPAVTARRLGPIILVDRENNSLTLFRPDNKVWRVFPVATGQAIYPTPAGRFQIIVKWVNPTWYPPTQDAWAAGLQPVPPGPDNPLGTRWMGLSAPGIGIHGTDEPGSIGYSESHGCIRMQVADSEWLFTKVRVGTTVFID